MMSLALHDRLIGRPGRAEGLARFLDYVLRARPRVDLPPAWTSRTTGLRTILRRRWRSRGRHDSRGPRRICDVRD